MRSSGLRWLVTLPCVAAGLLAGHLVGSHLALTHARVLLESADESSGAHSDVAPVVIGFLGAIALAGSALVAASLRRGSAKRLPPKLFLLLPLIAWPGQEALERLVHAEGGLHAHALVDPSLVLGMLLQIPFAMAAYALARFLFKVVIKIAAALTKRYPGAHPRSVRPRPQQFYGRSTRTRIAALRHAQRAPPLTVSFASI